MASFIGWLDHSAEEQQRTRELMRLLETPGTVDDLGFGSVRDAISNHLFPGTSINQTRARYFLFIPWIFRRAEQQHRRSVVTKGEDLERRLIPVLKASPDTAGLIGVEAGATVRILPSTIYWASLARLGIFLRADLTLHQYGRSASKTSVGAEHEDELAQRSEAFWLREMPDPPDDFFTFKEADFQLLAPESGWLCERLMSTEALGQPNLLGCLARQVTRDPDTDLGDQLWSAALPADASDHIRDLVHHGHRFSVAAHGASLLYNLMLAEQRSAEGDAERVERYRGELDEWSAEARRVDLGDWAVDLDPLWTTVAGSVVIPRRLVEFVADWAGVLTGVSFETIADDPEARTLVRRREIDHKRTQARFSNPKRLAMWNGGSGTQPLAYRWGQVRRMFTDIADGLRHAEREEADALAR